MPILYYQMSYEARKNKYVVKTLEKTRNIDVSKINGIHKYSKNLWVSKKREDLVEYAEKLKKNLIEEYEKKLIMINSRVIEV